jgi:hypothetical protein
MTVLNWLGHNWGKIIAGFVVVAMVIVKLVADGHFNIWVHLALVAVVALALAALGQVIATHFRLRLVGWLITGLVLIFGLIYAFYILQPLFDTLTPAVAGGVEAAAESVEESAEATSDISRDIGAWFAKLLSSDAFRLAALMIAVGLILVAFLKVIGGLLLIGGLVILLSMFFFPSLQTALDRNLVTVQECMLTPSKPECFKTAPRGKAVEAGCPEEKMVIPPGETVTFRRNDRCFNLRWYRQKNDTILVAVLDGDDGPCTFNWVVGDPPEYQAGTLRKMTLTNTGDESTTVWFSYR